MDVYQRDKSWKLEAAAVVVPCHPSSTNDGDQKSIWNDCGILPIDNVQRHPHAKGKKERGFMTRM